MLLLFKFFLCGLLTSLLFPPFFLTPLGFIIFPYLIYLLENNKNILNYRSHFLAGFLYGLGFFSIYLFWLREPFLLDTNTQNYAFFSYALIIYCSLYFGFIFFIIKFFKKIILKLLMFPLLIILSEYICGSFSYGFPWFSFSLVNSNNILGTTIIFYLGTIGLSYITILIFLFPYFFLLEKKKDSKFIFLTYLVLLISLLTLFFLNNFKYENDESSEISILISQMNFSANQHLDLKNKNLKLDKIVNIIKKSNSKIIIFGENEFPFLMEKENIVFFQSILKDNQNLIIGSSRKNSLKYYNSIFLINKNNYQKFDKKILVPFGEFIPFRHIFKFMKYIAGSNDFSSGLDSRILNLKNNFNILPVICYEIIYFSNLINKNNINTNIIINLTNDSWFGSMLGPYQHFYFTKLRAAEFNKPIIRVSTNGISGFIDNKGIVKDYIKLNKSSFKEIIFKIPSVKVHYLQYHKIFFLLLIFFFLLGLFKNKKND